MTDMTPDPTDMLAMLAAMAGELPGQGEADKEPAKGLPKAGRYFAEAVVKPERIAASGLAAVYIHQYSTDPATGQACQGVTPVALTDALCDLMGAALAPSAGLEAIEQHLLASAVLLGNAASAWLTYSMKAEETGKAEVFGRLALKAQEGQRKTLKALADIRSPKRATFIKQVNAAHQQVVNNGGRSSVAPQIENFSARKPSELLEVLPGERLDTRAQGSARDFDSRMEAVGAVHGAEDARGQGGCQDERLEARRSVAGDEGMEPRARPHATAVEDASRTALTGCLGENT